MALRRSVAAARAARCAAVCACSLLLAAAPAAAKEKNSQKSAPKAESKSGLTQESVREELDALRKDLDAHAEREKQRSKRAERLLAEMRSIDERLLASARKRRELKIEERDLGLAYDRTKERLDDIEKDYSVARGRLQKRLSSVYKRGRLGSTRVLAHAASSTEPLRMARYLAALSMADSTALRDFETLRDRHEATLAELDERKRDIAGKQAALQDEAQRYETAGKEKAMVLAGLQEELAAQKMTVGKLKEAEEDLERLLASIPQPPPSIAEDEPVGPEPLPPPSPPIEVAKAAVPEPVAPPLARLFKAERPSSSFKERKGDLEVPVRGRIVAGYGVDTEGAPAMHGLLLKPDRDRQVLAVARGEVVFAGPFPGLGNTLIINHGDRYHTVYAHLATLGREVGSRVRENDTVGTLAASGPTLHFELRAEGKAIDPTAWFRGGAQAFEP